MSPGALAFVGATALGLALGQLAALGAAGARARGPAAAAAVEELLGTLLRAGREGRAPGAAERRRLLGAGALLALLAGAAIAGPVAGAALAAAGPWFAARLLRARRDHYRAAVEAGTADMAVGIADALGAGHSLRGAVEEAASTLPGAAGRELGRVAAELAAGARTDDALEAMRARVPSAQVDTVVAACLTQRRAGGDLARLLRESADAFGDQARLEREARAATAQARFTGVLVVLLPVGGALLAELASPGFVAGLWGSFLTTWLMGIAVVLQLAAAVAIRRLGRVRW